MLTGKLSLNHPALNLRPELAKFASKGDEAKVVLFEPGDSLELQQTLHRVADLNSETATKLRDAKVRNPEEREYWREADGLRRELGEGWVELNNQSSQGLETAWNLAFSATFGLASTVIGSAESLGHGIERIGLYKQTSKEGILDQYSDISRLSGDHYHNNLREEPDPTPLFDNSASPQAHLLVDTKQGVAILENSANS